MTAVSVTAEHMANGFPGDCTSCPVALAVEDAFPQATGVTVGHRYISIDDGGQTVCLIIADDVQDLIHDIDAGDYVEPFSFDLDYPAVTP